MASTPPIQRLVRACDLVRALLLYRRRFRPLERARRQEVLSAQRARLAALLAHASRHSAFYRHRWGARTPGPADLSSLEPVTKAELLDRHFDEALAAPSLSKVRVREMLGRAGRPPFVVAATSGSTGEPVVYPYSRSEWIEGLALQLRVASLLRPPDWSWTRVLLGRPRVALLFTHHPIHVSTRIRQSCSLGFAPVLALSASSPLAGQTERLMDFQPAILGGYPSALGPLATAQLEGRFAIRPEVVAVGGETLTPGTRARLRRAWGVEPHDVYGLTETLTVAAECREHRGMHIFEDAVVLEVVDREGRVLPPGMKGDAVLLTNLFNRTLPVIRYTVTDLVTVTDEPCPCGLPFRRITCVEGRREETLELPGRRGGRVAVHPFAIESPIEAMAEVRRFQIRAEVGGVRILLLPRRESPDLALRAHTAVVKALEPLDIDPSGVRVELGGELPAERGPTGKQRRVLR